MNVAQLKRRRGAAREELKLRGFPRLNERGSIEAGRLLNVFEMLEVVSTFE